MPKYAPKTCENPDVKESRTLRIIKRNAQPTITTRIDAILPPRVKAHTPRCYILYKCEQKSGYRTRFLNIFAMSVLSIMPENFSDLTPAAEVSTGRAV